MTNKQMHSKNLSVELDKSRTTAKSLIIDGVDVSGCIVFNNKWGTPLCNPTEDIREAVHCSDNPNCLYKKYRRKEQECEEFKEKYELLLDNFLSNFYTGLDKKYDKLEQELQAKETKLKELKKELEVVKGLAKIRYQCLEAIKELANNANLPNVGLYIDSFLNKMFNKDENCHFDKIKELTKEM